MWIAITLQNLDTVIIGSRIRWCFFEGEAHICSEYSVIIRESYYLNMESVSVRGIEISESNRTYIPFPLEMLVSYGFEIWVE